MLFWFLWQSEVQRQYKHEKSCSYTLEMASFVHLTTYFCPYFIITITTRYFIRYGLSVLQ